MSVRGAAFLGIGAIAALAVLLDFVWKRVAPEPPPVSEESPPLAQAI